MKRFLKVSFFVLVIVSSIGYYSYKFLGDWPKNGFAPFGYSPAQTPEPESNRESPSEPPAITPVFIFEKLPEFVRPEAIFEIRWQIKTDFVVPYLRAGLYFDQTPHDKDNRIISYPKAANLYQGTLPESFAAQLTAPASGKLYVRANVLLEGVDYWSEEKIIMVSQ